MRTTLGCQSTVKPYAYSHRTDRQHPAAARADRGGRPDRTATIRRLDPLYEAAIRDTIERFEATGSPVITDGEQRKYHNFWTYCVHGLPNTAPDGFRIPFAAGHIRRMPRLTARPVPLQALRRQLSGRRQRYAHVPVKQAVISPSALSLMYPAEGIPGYSARAVHRRPAARARDRDPPLPREGRAQGPDRLHRGPAWR